MRSIEQKAKCRKSNAGCLAIYVHVSSYTWHIVKYTYVYVGTKTSNIDNMPTMFFQVHTATKKKRTCLMYRYVNICCDVYYHVSGNENVEQWPYAQRLTLASVAHGQSRVPWQKNCVCNWAARICTWICIVKHMYVSVNANYAAECHRNANNLGLCICWCRCRSIHRWR